jgi:hypothetical protein
MEFARMSNPRGGERVLPNQRLGKGIAVGKRCHRNIFNSTQKYCCKHFNRE